MPRFRGPDPPSLLDGTFTPQPDLFAFPLGLRLILWFGVVFFAAMLGFAAALPWLEPPKPGQRTEAVQVGCGVVFGSFLLLNLWLLTQIHDRYHVSPESISRLRPRRPPATMRWADVARIVDHPVHQRLELHGTDLDGRPLVLHLESQLERADLLRSIVMARTDWSRLIEDPAEPLILPVTIYKTTVHFVVMALVVLVFGGLAVSCWWIGVWWAAPVFLLVAMACLFLDWYAIQVDHGSLTLHHLLHARTISAESVCSIELATTRGQHYDAFPTVVLHLDTGKSIHLLGTRGGALRLYHTLALACPYAGRT